MKAGLGQMHGAGRMGPTCVPPAGATRMATTRDRPDEAMKQMAGYGVKGMVTWGRTDVDHRLGKTRWIRLDRTGRGLTGA